MAETVARQKERREKLEDILVVDCDVHVHESPGELAPYCDMPWRKALENVADVQEYYLDIPGFSPGMTWYEARFPSGHEGRRMVTHPDRQPSAQRRQSGIGAVGYRSGGDRREER